MPRPKKKPGLLYREKQLTDARSREREALRRGSILPLPDIYVGPTNPAGQRRQRAQRALDRQRQANEPPLLPPFDTRDRRAAADALPAAPEPLLPVAGTPPVLRAAGPRVPERHLSASERIRDAIISSADYVPLAGRALAETPFTVASEAHKARNPDELIHALTGVGLSMDPNSPAARPSDARGGRVQQGIALALNALPELASARAIGRSERAVMTALRNADRYAKQSSAALREFESILARQDPLNVPAFERAGGSIVEGPFNSLRLQLPRIGTALESAVREGFNGPGFTLDRTGKPFSGTGYAVALPRYTETLDAADPAAIARFLERPDVQAELANPDRYVGGWRDPETGQLEINLTQVTPKRGDAIALARTRLQKAIGRFHEGNYTGDMPVPTGREEITGSALRIGGKTYVAPFPQSHAHVLMQVEDALTDRSIKPGRPGRLKAYNDALEAASYYDEGYEVKDALGQRYFITRPEVGDILDASPTRFERNRAAPDDWHAYDVMEALGKTPGAETTPNAPPALISPIRTRKLMDALLPDEQRFLTRRTIPTLEAAGDALPDEEIFGAGAIAGGAKLGWYENSARALVETFGPDAPRFAALLAALSPQQPVAANLAAALDLWDVWNHLGRPQDPKAIARIMNDVARRNAGGGELPARIQNGIRALTAEDPAALALSGPKVFNFHRNLIGDAQRVTLDTWMQKLGGIGPNKLARTVDGFSNPSPTYLAFAGRVRQTADYLSRLTGRQWTPAEVQETLWSWGKALAETAEPMMRGQHPNLFDVAGPIANVSEAIPLVTPDKIRGVPDFATLMNEAPYSESIMNQGLPLPIARSMLPPPLPAPDPLGLDFLAGNLQRTLRNQRGALGGRPYREVFHGTTASGFGIPTKSSDIGPHVGTLGQSHEILRGAPFEHPGTFRDWWPEGANIIRLRDYTTNPIRVKDAGWGHPARLSQQLLATGALTQAEIEAALGGTIENSLKGLGFRPGDYEAQYAALNTALQQKGFDSLVYRNAIEGDRWIRDRLGRAHKVTADSRVILNPERDLQNWYDHGNAALPMLGLSGSAALGGLTLWQYLKNR